MFLLVDFPIPSLGSDMYVHSYIVIYLHIITFNVDIVTYCIASISLTDGEKVEQLLTYNSTLLGK